VKWKPGKLKNCRVTRLVVLFISCHALLFYDKLRAGLDAVGGVVWRGWGVVIYVGFGVLGLSSLTWSRDDIILNAHPP